MANKSTKLPISKQKHSSWRIDQDYWDKLNDEDKAYLRKFLDEYYHLSLQAPSIHSASHNLYAINNAARSDIVTITDEQAKELLTPRQRVYYTQDDYREPPCLRSGYTRKTPQSE